MHCVKFNAFKNDFLLLRLRVLYLNSKITQNVNVLVVDLFLVTSYELTGGREILLAGGWFSHTCTTQGANNKIFSRNSPKYFHRIRIFWITPGWHTTKNTVNEVLFVYSGVKNNLFSNFFQRDCSRSESLGITWEHAGLPDVVKTKIQHSNSLKTNSTA